MKFYVTADVHGFYTQFHNALEEAGWFADAEPHKLIILGDIFDRGQEAKKMLIMRTKARNSDRMLISARTMRQVS